MNQNGPLKLSEYKNMWLVAMFDLPVDTKEARKMANKFRKRLVGMGFSMLQLSVYGKFCQSEEASVALRNRVKVGLPPDGQVRLLSITDRQFGKMEIYEGKKREKIEEPPPQLMLF